MVRASYSAVVLALVALSAGAPQTTDVAPDVTEQGDYIIVAGQPFPKSCWESSCKAFAARQNTCAKTGSFHQGLNDGNCPCSAPWLALARPCFSCAEKDADLVGGIESIKRVLCAEGTNWVEDDSAGTTPFTASISSTSSSIQQSSLSSSSPSSSSPAPSSTTSSQSPSSSSATSFSSSSPSSSPSSSSTTPSATQPLAASASSAAPSTRPASGAGKLGTAASGVLAGLTGLAMLV